LNSAKKFVVSKTLKKLDWANSQLVSGDVPHEIRKLKGRTDPNFRFTAVAT